MTTWTERPRALRLAALATVVALLAACGQGGGGDASSSTSAAPPAATGDPDAVLNAYGSPEEMRAVLVKDPRFSGFDCAKASRTDTFGGRFLQCSKLDDKNLFVRLETYSDPAVGNKVDDGLSAVGWVVYPADSAAVAVAGEPTLIRDVIDALGR